MRAQVNTALRCPTVQSCFYAAVVHADILQSLSTPTLWPQSTPTKGKPWPFGGPLLLPGVLEFNTRASDAYIQSQVFECSCKIVSGIVTSVLHIASLLFKKFYLFIFNFWLHWIFIAVCGLFLAVGCRFLSCCRA